MNYIDKIKSFFLPRAGVAQIITDSPRTDPWAAYRGQFPPALKQTTSDPNGDDNIVLPVVAQIIDASVGAMLGKGIKIDVMGEGEEAAQKYLDAFLRRSRQDTTIKRACLHGAVTGHVFVKLLIDKDGKPDRFQALNSQSVSVETDPRDCTSPIAYTICWETWNDQTRRTDRHREVTRANDGGFWTITESVDEGSRNAWREVSRTEWPFEWSPIFDCQNLTNATGYWGSPDASRAIIAQNQSVNTVLSLCARLLRNHAHPKTVISGMGDKEFKWDTAGALLLAEGASASQLEATGAGAGAGALLDLAKHLQSTLHTTSRTPEVASGKLESAGNLSGVALAILFRPLIEKVSEKRVLMQEMLEHMMVHVLELGGYDGRLVDIVWPDVAPVSQTEQRTVAQIDRQLGVASLETVSKQFGYSYDDEQAQIAAEGVDAGGAILSALNAG